MTEQQLRKKAIERYLQGESPKAIYSDINRSKNWLFKWLKRYRSGEPEWFQGKSRAPQNSPRAIGEIEKQRIISTRKKLEAQRFAQVGASAIKWELSKSGYDLPSDRTINRVLKREGCIKKNFICSQRCRVSVFFRSTRYQ